MFTWIMLLGIWKYEDVKTAGGSMKFPSVHCDLEVKIKTGPR